MVEIKLFKDYNLSGYTVIEGFPSAGLVGPMAVSYMIDKSGYVARTKMNRRGRVARKKRR